MARERREHFLSPQLFIIVFIMIMMTVCDGTVRVHQCRVSHQASSMNVSHDDARSVLSAESDHNGAIAHPIALRGIGTSEAIEPLII